ncbi:hypothetical protein BWI96_11785 [Siphonobacter sp. SORGH_AS_0500]|uniref:DUF6371 domain-containing protein n=1 Tax=Siphonobacter sp. SORGH_AS_0500 TaxID=1864824 RepID=UPI000CADABDE|nr:DUF6371 domain-containing protein [Siphonobacter sp. SORGH_AS_0500]PKK36529.1 hypothetical protein BWI96_11785 [Siphonobacter sp. SORGH_AS_0500]
MKNELPPLKLDNNRKRVATCPCNKSNKDGKFAPYIGHDCYGYCHACGDTFLPPINREEGYDYQMTAIQQRPKLPEAPPSLIPDDLFKATLKSYEGNHFATFLESLFGVVLTAKLLLMYFVGSAKGGKTIFWQITPKGEVRAGKIMRYDPVTGKRSKTEHPNWVHSVMDLTDFKLKQVLFGSHLLTPANQSKTIAIVESEKTAILASAYLHNYIWLATGGSNGPGLTSKETLELLKGRRVILFPDVGAYAKWEEKAAQMRTMGIQALTSSLLESKGRDHNWDLADEFLTYREPLTLETGEVLNWALTEPDGYPLFWDQPVQKCSP